VSSAPQIRYPDCYGIDMARIEDFIAFRAMLALLNENKKNYLLKEVYEKSKNALENNITNKKNYVKILYNQFTDEEISKKIAEILKSDGIKSKVEVIFQSVEDLHKSCPNHRGDWYFTGNYPTAGGNKVVSRAFINFYEGKKSRAY
jgi:amidophosphoribosyltransferase